MRFRCVPAHSFKPLFESGVVENEAVRKPTASSSVLCALLQLPSTSWCTEARAEMIDRLRLRGGDRRNFQVHPPNDRKRDVEQWFAVLDRWAHASRRDRCIGRAASPVRSTLGVRGCGGQNRRYRSIESKGRSRIHGYQPIHPRRRSHNLRALLRPHVIGQPDPEPPYASGRAGSCV